MPTKSGRPVFAHVCLLVEDIQTAIADYQKVLEVIDPDQAAEYQFGENAEVGGDAYHVATFFNPIGGCEIQFMQPLSGPLLKRLEKRGEHVHHLAFASDDLEGMVEEVKERGIGVTSDELMNDSKNMPFQNWTFVNPKWTHGVLLELIRPYKTVNGQWISADEDVAAEAEL